MQLPTQSNQNPQWKTTALLVTGRIASAMGLPVARALWLGRQLSLISAVCLLSLCSYSLISNYFLSAILIQGHSMEPTLQHGQRYLLNRWSYHFRTPARGELVVLRDPGHDDCAVKRVIALPGELVDLKNGELYVNGQRVSEPYLAIGTRTYPVFQTCPVQLGPDQFFVLGDNRTESEDSRVYGTVHRTRILGCLAN